MWQYFTHVSLGAAIGSEERQALGQSIEENFQLIHKFTPDLPDNDLPRLDSRAPKKMPHHSSEDYSVIDSCFYVRSFPRLATEFGTYRLARGTVSN